MDAALTGALAAGAGGLVTGAALAAAFLWLKNRRAAPGDGKRPPQEADPALVDGHRPPDWEALSSQLLGLVRQVLDARGAVLLLPREGVWKVACQSPGLAVRPRHHVPVKEGLLGLAFEGEKEIAAAPVHAQSLGYLEEIGDLSVALTPVSHRGKVRGLIACHRAAASAFKEPELALLRRCATLLDGWESFASHAREMGRVLDQEERLARGLERMLGESDPNGVAGLALDALFDILPAVYGFAVIQSAKRDYTGLVTKRFDSPADFRYVQRETWAYKCMRERVPLYLEGAVCRDTAMPLLCAGEPFAAGAPALLVPLEAAEEVIGVVGVAGKASEGFDEAGREAARRFLQQTSALVSLALLNQFNKENALRDGLTGLYNRRCFDERLMEELRRSQRSATSLGLIIIDLDRFKLVNDQYGHDAGDAVLRAVAQAVSGALRSIDVVCRYGGEEFAVILPSCDLREAAAVAERARKAVSDLPGVPQAGVPGPITLSAGVASFPVPFSTPSGLLKAADSALYDAKRRGRNRVEIATR